MCGPQISLRSQNHRTAVHELSHRGKHSTQTSRTCATSGSCHAQPHTGKQVCGGWATAAGHLLPHAHMYTVLAAGLSRGACCIYTRTRPVSRSHGAAWCSH